MSHDGLAVGATNETKIDMLMRLARSSLPEELDVVEAQPLLAGRPSDAHPSGATTLIHTLDSEPLPLEIMPLETNMKEDRVELELDTESIHGSVSMEEGRTSVVPLQPHGHVLDVSDRALGMGWPTRVPPGSGAEFVAPLDEFPPLVKDHFRKIRDRFEAGSKHQEDGSRVRGLGLGQQDILGSDVQVNGASAGHSAYLLG